jgi:cyclomaltodextrinase / maltogenic alpha-amylase / neopullulanase
MSMIFEKAFVVLFVLFFTGCAVGHRGPEPVDGGVRFSLHAPAAKSVAISGSFNRWDTTKDLLAGPDSSGGWSIVLPLPEGRHEYLFIMNGETWLVDPAVPSVDDGLGGKNSVIVIRK